MSGWFTSAILKFSFQNLISCNRKRHRTLCSKFCRGFRPVGGYVRQSSSLHKIVQFWDRGHSMLGPPLATLMTLYHIFNFPTVAAPLIDNMQSNCCRLFIVHHPKCHIPPVDGISKLSHSIMFFCYLLTAKWRHTSEVIQSSLTLSLFLALNQSWCLCSFACDWTHLTRHLSHAVICRPASAASRMVMMTRTRT